MLPSKLAFVDLETSGGHSSRNRIIEIGIVRMEDNVITKTYQTLLNPHCYIPPEIEALTGIKAADLEGAPLFYDVKDEVLEILKDCIFVAHNVRFDYGFLKSEFNRVDIPFSPKQFCTVKLSRALFPQHLHHNLDAVKERFNLTCTTRHRAFDDAHMLYQFYQKIQQQFSDDVIEQAINITMKKPSMPIKLSHDVLDALPETPGVYIFYGSEDGTKETEEPQETKNVVSTNNQAPITDNHLVPLYIGKSKNIRDRVLSHFSSDIRSGFEMTIAQQVSSIETIQTAGELGALITESQLIKSRLPIYNKRLRQKHELLALRKKTTTDGYETVSLEPIKSILPTELDQFLGFFQSKKQAKLFLSEVALEHSLCEKLLGLEKSDAACFGYRLDRCKGACIGKELYLKYNMRFVAAFSKRKIKPWPFSGPIMIEEIDEFTRKKEYFLLHNWCLFGSVKSEEELVDMSVFDTTVNFDLDIYKILVGFMRSPRNMNAIKQLNTKDFTQIITKGYGQQTPSLL